MLQWVRGERSGKRSGVRRTRPGLEVLEDRTVPATLVVNTLQDVVNPFDGLTSLREAMARANAQPGADTITFAPALAGGTIDLDGLSQLPKISDNLTITSSGKLTVRAHASRVFE